MIEKEHIFDYNKYDTESENNSNNEQCPNTQLQTMENGNSYHQEVPKAAKTFKTQLVGIKNEDTKKGKTKGTSKKNTSLYEKETRYQTKETTLLGKKRPEPNTPNYEINFKEVCENALINIIQFLNEISLYVYNSGFTISKDLIKREYFSEKNLDKNIKEILLMMEDIGFPKTKSIKNKIKSFLELDLEHKSEILPFCKNIFETKLKELLLIHINDLNFKLYNFRLKTLKDNPIYSEEEKMEIRNQIINYLNPLKEQTNSINDNNEIINQPISDLNILSHVGSKEEKLSSENIISDMENKKNQAKDDKQLFKISKEPNENNKTNNDEKGEEIANLKRRSVKKCFKSICKMIEKIKNVKLEKVSTYDDISFNSAEQYLAFFDKKIGDIIKINNNKFINSILISKDTTEETKFLKWLLETKFSYVFFNFINGCPIIFTRSKEEKIELKLLKDVKNKSFRKKIEKIKDSMNAILNANGRLREKKNK